MNKVQNVDLVGEPLEGFSMGFGTKLPELIPLSAFEAAAAISDECGVRVFKEVEDVLPSDADYRANFFFVI